MEDDEEEGDVSMADTGLVLKDYRMWVKAKIFGEDSEIETEIRKLSRGKNISKRGSVFKLDFDEVEIKMGEDLLVEIIRLVIYMLPEEVVQEIMEEYCENRLKWL